MASHSEKRPHSEEDDKVGVQREFHDTAEGYGAMPDDPDAGLSAEERAAIVSCHGDEGQTL